MARDETRKPFTILSDGLEPEVAAELQEAFRRKSTVHYEGSPWLVQKLEAHRDHGPGTQVQRFTLIPAKETDAADGSADGTSVPPANAADRSSDEG